MRLRRLILPVAFICATVALMMPSCQSSDCLDLRSGIPYAGFYASSTGDPIALDSLEIGGVMVPHDSLLVTSGKMTQGLYLPVRSNRDNTSYFIHYTYGYLNEDLIEDDRHLLDDTITLYYKSTPYFVSQECGAMFRYHIDSVKYTTHLIDSVVCTDPLVTNVDIERLKIYFRVSAEPDEEEGSTTAFLKGGRP